MAFLISERLWKPVTKNSTVCQDSYICK